MSKLLDLRQAIIVGIRGAIGGMEVEGHLGRFTEQQLREFMIKAPAARVAMLGLADIAQVADDGFDATAQVGIYVVTKDGATKLSRDEAAIAAVEAIVLLCDRNRWGLGAYVRAGKVNGAQNLYSEVTLKEGVALWAVDLRVPVRLTSLAPEAGQLLDLYLGVAPNIGTGHEADYIKVGSLEGVDV